MPRTIAISLRVGPQGRIVIPAQLRRELELRPGETLIAHVESHRLVLERREQILERLRSELRPIAANARSTVDELIAERREAARSEADEPAE